MTLDRKWKVTGEEADRDRRPEEEDESGSCDRNRNGKKTVLNGLRKEKKTSGRGNDGKEV